MGLSDIIETEEQLQHALQYWKNFSFNPAYIKLEEAVCSLEADKKPVVNAYHQFAPRWVVGPPRNADVAVCTDGYLVVQLTKRGTKKDAVFHSVGIWRWNSHLETGNYVPVGETAPERLAEDRM